MVAKKSIRTMFFIALITICRLALNIVWLHSMIYQYFTGHNFILQGGVHLMQKELRKTVSRAVMLLADSHYALPDEKIVVAPLACNEHFYLHVEAQPHTVLVQYQLKWRRFFYISALLNLEKYYHVATRMLSFECSAEARFSTGYQRLQRKGGRMRSFYDCLAKVKGKDG